MASTLESEQQYGCILTLAGENAEQTGKTTNTQIEFKWLAIGDANDEYIQPIREQTGLVNERACIQVNSVDVFQATDESVPMLKVEAILPEDVNNLVIREFALIGLFQGNEYVHAVGNCARIHVPSPANNGNVGTPVSIEMLFIITSAEPIIEIEAATAYASREFVNENIGYLSDDLVKTVIDQTGKNWFIDDGFKIGSAGTAGSFSVTPGVGYVSGFRIEQNTEYEFTADTYPQIVCVDVSFHGILNKNWEVKKDFILSEIDSGDYIDENGIQHYVCKIAVLHSSSEIEDLRGRRRPVRLWVPGGEITNSSEIIRYTPANGLEFDVYVPAASVDNPIIMGDSPDDDALTFMHRGSARWEKVVTPEDPDIGYTGNLNEDAAPYIAEARRIADKINGRVRLNGQYTLKTYVEDSLDIDIELSGKIYIDGGGFRFSGSIEEERKLAEDIIGIGSNLIKLTDFDDIQSNDFFFIHSATNCLSSDAGDMQLGIPTGGGDLSWFGEFFTVKQVALGIVETTTPLVFGSYLTTPETNSDERQYSYVTRVRPVKVNMSGHGEFIRLRHGLDMVKFKWGMFSIVSTIKFNHQKFAGGSVDFETSIHCNTSQCDFYLDDDTPIRYGDNNPDAPYYYEFNTLKCRSSTSCGDDGSTFSNGTQNFDVTYSDAPSIQCWMKNSTVKNAKFNVATSHGGSYATTFSNITGVGAWGGIACRSREDVVIGCKLTGFRNSSLNPYRSGEETHGISFSEGFTVHGKALNNDISGFDINYKVINTSTRGSGFPYLNVTLKGGESNYCKHHVYASVWVVDGSSLDDKLVDSSLIISGITFKGNTEEAIIIGNYIRRPRIRNCEFISNSKDDIYYHIRAGYNCIGVEAANNSFDQGRILKVMNITDSELGEDHVMTAAVLTEGNVEHGDRSISSYAYGNEVLSSLTGFNPNNLGYKKLYLNSSDTLIDSSTHDVINMYPEVDGIVITEITPAALDGREMTICSELQSRPVVFSDSDTIRTRSGTVEIRLNSPCRFIFINGQWIQLT
ncbi:phage tail-collar fiber domain-containing protein [Shewanella surugensis]|uniref:Phage tail protein n=1 Tax=Shewanella surugensis TaxID=212020 RepID=A0ABT0L9D9_9GAMM|nr:phage tail protein [Shewanella surugensis]MCL1124164.1 phage tail protein [Shewanella surugensis]